MTGILRHLTQIRINEDTGESTVRRRPTFSSAPKPPYLPPRLVKPGLRPRSCGLSAEDPHRKTLSQGRASRSGSQLLPLTRGGCSSVGVSPLDCVQPKYGTQHISPDQLPGCNGGNRPTRRFVVRPDRPTGDDGPAADSLVFTN